MVDVKAPIIVDNHGDLSVYGSLEKAIGDLEPVDVRNGEYIAYDSEGRLLNVVVETSRPWKFSIFQGPRDERIGFIPTEDEPTHSDELRTKLIHFLKRVGEDENWALCASLEELVNRSVQRYKT
jgi:hypothetical protein